MTYEERKQQVCDSCNKNNCGYKCRALIDKCEYVQSVMEGWELGQQDTINKACEWLKHRGCLYIKYTEAGTGFDDERFIKDFRKAMED